MYRTGRLYYDRIGEICHDRERRARNGTGDPFDVGIWVDPQPRLY